MKLIGRTFYFVAVGFGTLLILITVISQFHSNHWYLEILNFPRLSILIALPLCGIASLVLATNKNKTFLLFIFGIIFSMALQSWTIFPYTAMAEKSVKSIRFDQVDSQQIVGIMVVNVLMSNRNSNGLLKLISETKPNVLLATEVNDWWVSQFHVLHNEYPYRVVFPTSNTYGIALYSKFPLSDQQLLFLTNKNVPSILCNVVLPSGQEFRLLAVHPVAPKPSVHPDNMGKKADGLLKAARLVAGKKMPTIVAGDFNDVGWSYNMAQFKAISQLSDVRRGRGLYTTFSAQSGIFKWPLDHVYVSDEFKVLGLKKLPAFGSDHYPFYAQIAFCQYC